MKLEVIGCYSPNIRFKPTTCYKIRIAKKNLFLDMGYGNLKKTIKYDLNNSVIIISHNHVDHVLGLIQLARYLKKKKIKLNNKIKVYMPKNNKGFNIYKYVKKYDDWFDLEAINKDSKIELNNVEITFCETIHKGETYAIKLKYGEKVFVYTSDIAKVDKKLQDFIKNANLVLMEGGHPVSRTFSLGDYHRIYKRFT